MSWSAERRAFLKSLGLGAAFLPLLRATGAAAESEPLRKLIIVTAIHGYRQKAWAPPVGVLTDPLPPSCVPLEAHKHDLVFTAGLAQHGGSGDAAYSTLYWGLPDTAGPAPYLRPNGRTLDQLVGEATTPPGGRPTVNLGVQLDRAPAAPAPAGRTCHWLGARQPVAAQLDPQAVYRDLFASRATPDPMATARLRFRRQSVLDYVGGSLDRFATRVGTEDRMAIEAHKQSIRELERSLDAAAAVDCGTAPPNIALFDPEAYAAVLEAQTRLLVTSLTCGVTRVATLQLADARGESTDFAPIVPGISDPLPGGTHLRPRTWADLARDPVVGGVDHKQLVDTWLMGRLADLIDRLAAAPDARGTRLFDNSVILWANPVEEGGNHDSIRMPWLLAGRCGGRLRTGQSLSPGGPSTGVLAAIATAMGVQHPFGAPLLGLLA